MYKLEFKIDNRSKVLEHLQIATLIKKYIVNQMLEESHFKTPKIFAKIYNINLSIVLDAFESLVNEHVFKVDGNGNYYNAYEQRLNFITEGVSSVEFIQSIQMKPKVEIVLEENIIITEKNYLKTNFPIGEKIIKQTRLFKGDDIPVIYAFVYFLEKDKNLFEDIYVSMKKSLEKKYSSLRNIRIISSVTMPNNINKILNQPQKMVGTLIKETIDNDGHQLYYGEFYYNRYYTIKLEL